MRKINRILDNEEFTQILNNGKKIRCDQFLLAYRKNELNHLRVGISVSKKVGGAVVRVKVRRQIRAMFDDMNILDESFNIVVIPKPNFLKNSFEENYGSLRKNIYTILNDRR